MEGTQPTLAANCHQFMPSASALLLPVGESCRSIHASRYSFSISECGPYKVIMLSHESMKPLPRQVTLRRRKPQTPCQRCCSGRLAMSISKSFETCWCCWNWLLVASRVRIGQKPTTGKRTHAGGIARKARLPSARLTGWSVCRPNRPPSVNET